jgi:hypothetical protein
MGDLPTGPRSAGPAGQPCSVGEGTYCALVERFRELLPESQSSKGNVMDPAETLLTTRDLAHRWQVNIGSLANDRSARRGVPFVKIGGVVRYRLRDVEAYEATCRISTLDAS